MATALTESILESINNIDEVVQESEYDVMMSMADVYLKSALIMESSDALYDGEVVMEADGVGFIDKLKSAGGNIVAMIKKIAAWIVSAIKSIPGKVKAIWVKLRNHVRSKKMIKEINKNNPDFIKAWEFAGCKVVPNGEGIYGISYPNCPNVELLGKDIQQYIAQFEKLAQSAMKVAQQPTRKGLTTVAMARALLSTAAKMKKDVEKKTFLVDAEENMQSMSDLISEIVTVTKQFGDSITTIADHIEVNDFDNVKDGITAVTRDAAASALMETANATAKSVAEFQTAFLKAQNDAMVSVREAQRKASAYYDNKRQEKEKAEIPTVDAEVVSDGDL